MPVKHTRVKAAILGTHECKQNVNMNVTVNITYRDADETKEWIEEKNQALNTDNYGHDLASVQALQRKHEGFERDLAALGDKVRGGGQTQSWLSSILLEATHPPSPSLTSFFPR